jgi:uracil-DNA glycosylase family 4
MFQLPAEQKRAQFAAIAAEAAACRRCPAMCERRAVLSELNGCLSPRVMFLGEAPGRQGGDRTRVPFSGDQSGRNFERFIASIKLKRADVFIANAVLCNPRKASGANRTPTAKEIANCSGFLRRLVEVIDPPILVTLGAVSLAALRLVEYHDLTLKEAAGQIYQWNNRWLVPVYHPSPQVLASHRRDAAQLQDYRAIALALRRARFS